MKKILIKVFVCTLILCGCHQDYVPSYFYDIKSDDLEKNLSISYEIDIKESDSYCIYLNYFVDDINKWDETADFIHKELASKKYQSSVFIFDENKKLLYGVKNFPITRHHSNYKGHILSLTLYPKYFPLEKGKRYYLHINTNVNKLNFNNDRKQIEVTYRYTSK